MRGFIFDNLLANEDGWFNYNVDLQYLIGIMVTLSSA
jgi:hypothetical protein